MILVSACFGIEARWIDRGPDVRVVRTPMGARAAEGLAGWDCGFGAEDVLISAGFCGGLRETLACGDLVLADRVRAEDGEIYIDAGLLDQARRALGASVCVGAVAARTHVVETRQAKRELAASGTVAVDMESGVLGRWAAEHDVRFLVLRAVLDPWDEDLVIRDATIGSVLRHPLAAMRLGRRATRAGRAMGEGIARLRDVLSVQEMGQREAS